MAAGISGGAGRGILVKGGVHLEHLGTIRTVAFDKTGTLTHGRPRVVDVVPIGVSADELLSRAAAIEQLSEHPLARAVLDRARQEGLRLPPANDFVAITGAGARAQIDGETWYVGKASLFRDLRVDLSSLQAQATTFEAEGKTVVLVGNATCVLGLITLQDTLRENARETIDALHDLGIHTVMLTGDNESTARRIAALAGIDDVRAGLLPEEKVACVRELLRSGPLLMVGDGVNDAPALAAATCGVAMGAAGADATIEAADVALMADDLEKLVEALALGRKARRVSLENIVFSIAVLAVLIPTGVGGHVGITVAVLAHEASELLAVANGLRARSP